MARGWTVKGLAVLAVVVGALVSAGPAGGHMRWNHGEELATPLVHEIEWFRAETWDLQEAMGETRFPSEFAERRSNSEAYRTWIRDLWRDRLAAAEARYEEWRESQSASSGGWGVWSALAECESGGDWAYNGGSGFDGGLQFHPGTWSAYAPPGFPSEAWAASPAQQIAVAEAVLNSQGWGAWPACSSALGLR
jgi:Transglycosylase-like domain